MRQDHRLYPVKSGDRVRVTGPMRWSESRPISSEGEVIGVRDQGEVQEQIRVRWDTGESGCLSINDQAWVVTSRVVERGDVRPIDLDAIDHLVLSALADVKDEMTRWQTTKLINVRVTLERIHAMLTDPEHQS